MADDGGKPPVSVNVRRHKHVLVACPYNCRINYRIDHDIFSP